jgi:hypothetical protein
VRHLGSVHHLIDTAATIMRLPVRCVGWPRA